MESTAQSLVGNAAQILSAEYQLLSGVGGEVTELRDDLATMNALIRMHSEADEGAVDHFVREWMKQLSELSYDSEDCVDLYKLRVKSRPDASLRDWLERLLYTFMPRHHLACKIRALRARATAISERHARYYGIDRDAMRGSVSFAPPMLVASALSARALRRADDHEKQVLEEQAAALAEQVKASIEERRPKVFFIVGSKGDDRTRLAETVCLRLEADFPFQASALVPQPFEPSGKNLETLVKQVFEQIANPKTGNGNAIKDKRYLIVINDVRTIAAWDAIRFKLPNDNSQSIRIIVTTPTEGVTKGGSHDRVGGHYTYRMKPLSLQADHHRLVGVKDQVNSIVKELKLKEVENVGLMGVLSIVGFGGVGKTTLAMELCRQLEEEFPFQAMVSVSQAFEHTRDLKPLFKRVLDQLVMKRGAEKQKGINDEWQLDLQNIDVLDADHLAAKLKESLKDNRYLIVIDDVWTIRAWEAIQTGLPENNCNSRIIVTTRINTVAKACSLAGVSRHYIHHMEPLKLEDSKTLFLSRVFGYMNARCPKELEDAMVDILKKCGGLPLAIISIANVLASYTSSGSKEKWTTVSKSIGSQMESNPTLEGMRHIVTLSYNHLPYELKRCMMYLSIFPEDYKINKDRLLARWIAEGLVLEKRGQTRMNVAEYYLEELLSRSMIELRHDIVQGLTIEFCQVHDVLLEVMVSKSLECNFASLLGGQYQGMSYDRIRRLSIHGEDKVDISAKEQKKKKVGHGIEGMDVEHVRSLSMFQLEGKKSTKLLDHLLHKFTLLRVLDLEDCEALTNDHMKYICRLYLLKFLSLNGTDISQVPAQVGKLEHLQTFNVHGTNLEDLPVDVTKLEKLDSVDFDSKIAWYHKWRLPRGVKNMKALRKADYVTIENDIQVAEEVGELQQLEILAMCLKCLDENVMEMLASSLSKIYSLRVLKVAYIDDDSCVSTVLYNLPKPPQLLRILWIDGPLHRGLPSWVGSLMQLVEIGINHASLHGDELFNVLCKLPNLKSIMIHNYCWVDDKIVAKASQEFPVLSNLGVVASYGELPKHVEFEDGSMANLKTLRIFFPDTGRRISGLKHLESLKEVELMGRKGNPYLNAALVQLKDVNKKHRHESNQIQVVVKYRDHP